MEPRLYVQSTETVIDTIMRELDTTYAAYTREADLEVMQRNRLARSHWAKGLLAIYVLLRHIHRTIIDTNPAHARAMDKVCAALTTLAEDEKLLSNRYHWDNYRLDLVSFIISKPSLRMIPSTVDDVACCLGIPVSEYLDAGILTVFG